MFNYSANEICCFFGKFVIGGCREPNIRLKLLEAADDAGFFCYHLAEHHATLRWLPRSLRRSGQPKRYVAELSFGLACG
jgi:hypothetical protein